ncbi:DNA polymerase subunit Cdc27 [Dendryphion nanum]|uniref:DNA polymerase delta subunit 3 n=1 Tax=Dendryphion nanum TaxID=256645 RepID=A0A9P9D920_9PLEO|nr:DNA polymerase subunit Cdc27 [Dendryphion nanum]
MADEYKEYLASRVLMDSQPITYRFLSRALKVNVSVAKHMLYEFHSKENARKPNSVHATYLLTGRKQDVEHTNGTNGTNGTDGADTIMRSSPPMSSMPDIKEEPKGTPILKTFVVLVREEELEAVKQDFDDITSIHIYSLESGPIENLNILATCNQEVAKQQATEDPLKRWSAYGSIHNPYIKRRTAKFVPKPTAAASKYTAQPTVKPAAKPASKPNAASIFGSKAQATSVKKGGKSEDDGSDRSAPPPAAAVNTLKKSDSKPNLKREKSSILNSFAKAKPKAKEAEKSKESTPAPPEDEPMLGMSEDEGVDEEEVKIDQEKQAAARKARAEREEKLRKMMEDDDEDMPDAPAEEEKASQETDGDKAAEEEPDEVETVTTEGGRRRGRRKVMKKTVRKDADGYLVTKEEVAWESFSEEEPVPKKLKPAPKPTNTVKGKKGAKGQGSIASFFKKA